jgi:hypothetical protein
VYVVVGPMVAAIGSTRVSGDHSEPSRGGARAAAAWP